VSRSQGNMSRSPNVSVDLTGWDRQLFGGLEDSEPDGMLGRCAGTFSFMRTEGAWAVNVWLGGLQKL